MLENDKIIDWAIYMSIFEKDALLSEVEINVNIPLF